jgi:hypothetical protein
MDFYITFGGGVLLAFFVLWFDLSKYVELTLILLWIIIGGYITIRFNGTKCPRCKNLITSNKNTEYINPFTSKCLNCGLHIN